MQLRASRQTVTGLTVNKKVNVPQHYYKLARAMTHQFLSTGSYERDGVNETSLQRLEGILNYIYHIRERQIDLAIAADKNKERQDRLHEERTKAKNTFPSSIRLVYYRLTFFKHFIDPPKPLIICEGPTDSV
jgi:RNA-directed DNA polymerase